MAGVLEIAITHRVGPRGQREVCERPSSTREMAVRLHKWAAETETCKSCLTLPAMSVVAGWALCGRCREQRAIRLLEGPGLPATRVEPSEEGGTALQGYAIRFNEESVDLGGFTEIIRPGAIDRTLSSRLDVRALWNHNSDLPIGRRSAGTLGLEKRTVGLYVDVRPPKWAHAQIESVDRRDVTGQSFGFVVVTDDWHVEDKRIIREVLDMEVHETSIVAFPAYPTTTVKAVNAAARTREAETGHRLRMAR